MPDEATDLREPRSATGGGGPRSLAIEVNGLSKRFGPIEAVKGISLEVAAGETFGFLGPNGAGKSTTISILCTLSDATSGKAQVAGFDVFTQQLEVRRRIGLVFQDTTLDDYLTAAENLRLHAELYGLTGRQTRERVDQMLAMVELSNRRDNLVRTFSGGMKRRLEIARGLLHSPRVLFLDEPTLGLDPQTRSHIWKYIGELRDREGITIFMTTHYLEEAEFCDRIAIIDAGEIVAIDTPAALKAGVGRDRVQLQAADDNAAVESLRERFGIEATVSDGRLTLYTEHGEQFVPRLFAELGVPITSVSITRPTLDDVFMAYTGRTIRDAEASAAEQLRAHPMMRGGPRR